MRIAVRAILIAAVICLAPAASWADLMPYSQDFEGLSQGDAAALANDPAPFPNGWVIWVNVYGPDWAYWYNYGQLYPAPNGGPGFSAIASGAGGQGQGAQQLVIYNDYNNGNHGDGSGAIIEANVYHEQVIGAADVGTTWVFEFDAKRGDIGGASMAAAFIKTLNPAAGYALTNFLKVDTASIPDSWDSYTISIDIDSSLEGQILQFGFMNWASNYEPSGVVYDNVSFMRSVDVDIKPGSCPNPLNTRPRGVVTVAVLGTGMFDVNDIDVSSLRLEGVAPIRWGYQDVAAPFAGDLCGCNESGPDTFLDLTMKFKTAEIMDILGEMPAGELTMSVTGNFLDGTPFVGKDCVVLFTGGPVKSHRLFKRDARD